MSLVIDANVIVSAFLDADANHVPSLIFLAELPFIDEPLLSPTLLMPECAGALMRGTDDEAAARKVLQIITRLRNLELVPLSLSLARLSSHVALTMRLRGADACYAATAKDLDATLITWDKEMLRRCPPGVTCLTPDQWRAQHPRRDGA